jgi:hypothetical protein
MELDATSFMPGTPELGHSMIMPQLACFVFGLEIIVQFSSNIDGI